MSCLLCSIYSYTVLQSIPRLTDADLAMPISDMYIMPVFTSSLASEDGSLNLSVVLYHAI
jgi:hypothetical protein